jgi:probable HAF family extracellular repeat protein
MKELFLAALIACCGLAGLALAANVHYKFSPAGNYPGAFDTAPLAANLTKIVGAYESGGGAYAAYIQTLRTPTGAVPRFFGIAPPGSGGSYASGINAHGVVAGGYCSGCIYPQSQHGFTWDHGTFTTIDYPGAKSTGVYGINDHGQIVGGFCPTNNVCAGTILNPTAHAFLDDHGTFTELDYPGSFETQANAINNTGQIVGTYGTTQGLHSFLYQNGKYTNIDDPNAVWTNATAINNHFVAAGYYADSQLNTHGFLYHNGKFTTVDHPNAGSTSLAGINDNGMLVGVWFTMNNLLYNFKGTPVH